MDFSFGGCFLCVSEEMHQKRAREELLVVDHAQGYIQFCARDLKNILDAICCVKSHFTEEVGMFVLFENKGYLHLV